MGKCYVIPSLLTFFRLSEDIPMAFFRYRRVSELPPTVNHNDDISTISEIHQDDILYLASYGIPKNEPLTPANAEQASDAMPVSTESVPTSETTAPYPEGTVIYYYEITFLFDDCTAKSPDECAHFAWFHGEPGAPVEANQNS
jgi:hypothetical protein